MQFIVLAHNDWQGQWMNRQQLFSRIAEKHHVVYTNGPLFMYERHSNKFKKSPFCSKVLKSGHVYIHQPGLLNIRTPNFNFFDRFAVKTYVRSLQKILTAKEPVILYIFHPDFYEYVEHIKHDLLVYHAYDDFSKQDSYNEKLKIQDMAMVEQADIVITSSQLIHDRYHALNKNNDVHFIPNGVDFNTFSKTYDEPKSLSNIPHPRVCYVGAINKKVDLDLFKKLASDFPIVSFILVGPVNPVYSERASIFSQLITLKNVFYLGNKDASEIASYMSHSDINTMIYTVNNKVWASSGYPLKLHEYLAVGKPVIASDIHAVREFSDVVDIAKKYDDWVAFINKHIKEIPTIESINARKVVAKSNTWDTRVQCIIKLIQNKLIVTSNRT